MKLNELEFDSNHSSIRCAAMALLARREHSRKELKTKLLKRFPFPDTIESVLDSLSSENLQSDQRYLEAFVTHSMRKGQGPIRIEMELRERGLDSELISTYLENYEQDWNPLAKQVRQRRFGDSIPEEMPARAKQMRFLQYRGFTSDQINAAFPH